jgi:nitrate reductase NapE component
MIPLEGGNYDGIVILILAIMFGPPALLTIIGLAIVRKKKTPAIVLFILAVVYLIIGVGICGGILS